MYLCEIARMRWSAVPVRADRENAAAEERNCGRAGLGWAGTGFGGKGAVRCRAGGGHRHALQHGKQEYLSRVDQVRIGDAAARDMLHIAPVVVAPDARPLRSCAQMGFRDIPEIVTCDNRIAFPKHATSVSTRTLHSRGWPRHVQRMATRGR